MGEPHLRFCFPLKSTVLILVLAFSYNSFQAGMTAEERKGYSIT